MGKKNEYDEGAGARLKRSFTEPSRGPLKAIMDVKDYLTKDKRGTAEAAPAPSKNPIEGITDYTEGSAIKRREKEAGLE